MNALHREVQRRLYFSRRPRSFNIVARVVLYAAACWESRLRLVDVNRLDKALPWWGWSWTLWRWCQRGNYYWTPSMMCWSTFREMHDTGSLSFQWPRHCTAPPYQGRPITRTSVTCCSSRHILLSFCWIASLVL